MSGVGARASRVGAGASGLTAGASGLTRMKLEACGLGVVCGWMGGVDQ